MGIHNSDSRLSGYWNAQIRVFDPHENAVSGPAQRRASPPAQVDAWEADTLPTELLPLGEHAPILAQQSDCLNARARARMFKANSLTLESSGAFRGLVGAATSGRNEQLDQSDSPQTREGRDGLRSGRLHK